MGDLTHCYVCKEEFEEDYEPLEILGGKYAVHDECFVCAGCGKELKKFFMKEGKLYCANCGCAKCKECGKGIEGQVVRVGEDRYHPNCFKCPECGEVIGTKDYKLRDGKVLCMKCAEK